MSETSSSSDDSDFVPMDISEADMNLIIQLDTALQTNPASYDAHVQLIEVLRRCNMRERLRDARLNMQEKFPLSESLWLDWISDELDAAAGEEDVVRVIDLLERAHNDYLSVPLWIQHLEYVLSLWSTMLETLKEYCLVFFIQAILFAKLAKFSGKQKLFSMKTK